MTASKATGRDWQTILILAISVLGIVFFAIQVLVMGIFWLVSLIDPATGIQQAISIGLFMWSSILAGLLLIPLIILSINRLRGKPVPDWLDTRRPTVRKFSTRIILLWPLVVLLGWLVAGQPPVAVFLLGPINVIVAGIPVLWIYHNARKDLEGGSQLRLWQIFGFSITVMPILVIIAEILALVVLGGFGLLWFSVRIALDPQLEQELMQIINQLSALGDDVDAIIQLFEPYLLQPGVLVWVFAVFAGIIPIIEEAMKPMALWLLARKKVSPQIGFVSGLVCGAGFALVENVLYFTTVVASEEWLFMAIGRAGTGVLHMLASGLVGWGLAKAWLNRNWIFLVLTTIAAFLFHGLWNGFALVSGFAPIYILGEEPTLGQSFLFFAPVFVLLLVSVIVLFIINRHLSTTKTVDEIKASNH